MKLSFIVTTRRSSLSCFSRVWLLLQCAYSPKRRLWVCTNNLIPASKTKSTICSPPSALTLIILGSYQNTPEPSVQKWNPMTRCVHPFRTTCHNHRHTLHPPSPIKTPSKWEQHVGGCIVRECTRHSKIFFHSEKTAGRGLHWAGLCGCGPGFVRSLSEATSEPWALCNVIWMGRGGFPLGFRRTATEVQCRDGRSVK